MLDPILNIRRVDQESEFLELQAEAKRRQREWEGIPDEPNMLGRYKVGRRKQAGAGMSMQDAIAARIECSGVPDLYIENEEDQKALDRELADLVRDAELMEKHETVRYE